ncbi:MAG: FCD domain-containing protein [Actinomycetaceae bacterium]|nr:FCD domain-containing protein [Actinomycetaceae bacterium]
MYESFASHEVLAGASASPPTTDHQHSALLDTLGRQIATGGRSEGSILTLAGVEEEFGVSRTVAREVVKVLEGLGMVWPRRRVGIIVQAREQWHVLDPRVIRWRMSDSEGRLAHFHSMNELRRGIEPEAARLAARRSTPDDSDRLMELAERMLDLGRAGQGSTPQFLAADTAFHELIFRMCGNEIIGQLGSSIGSLLTERTHWSLQPDYPNREAMDAHVRLAGAVRAHDEDAAFKESAYIVAQADEEVSAGGPERGESGLG